MTPTIRTAQDTSEESSTTSSEKLTEKFETTEQFQAKVSVQKFRRAKGLEPEIVETTPDVMTYLLGDCKELYVIYENVPICKYGDKEKVIEAMNNHGSIEAFNHPLPAGQTNKKSEWKPTY